MASRAISYSSLIRYILDRTIRFDVDPIRVALLASTYDPVRIWEASTAFSAGAYRQPTAKNGHYYLANTSGTTDAIEPTWPTTGGTVIDGGVEWQDMGTTLPVYGGEDTVWADVSAHEITGTGYSTGGAVVTGVSVDSDPDKTIVSGDNVEWLNSTLEARYAVRYMDANVNGVDKPLIACTLLDDSPGDVSSDNATFTYQWSENGIYRQRYESI